MKTKWSIIIATEFLSAVVQSWAGASPPLTIASNGVAQAFIVVDAGAGVSDAYAAGELASYLYKVTGSAFPIHNVLQPGGPNLLVGADAALLGDPAFTTAALGEEGIVIRRAGSHMILAGAETRGTLYAVYTFLEDQVGVHWWTRDDESYPIQPTLSIAEPDLTYVPPFEYRETGFSKASNGDFSARNKYNGHLHDLEDRHGGTKYQYIATSRHFVHTYWTYLPPEDYFATHPDWYALFNGVHDTRGLNLLNEDMRQEFMANLRTFLLANQHATLVSISELDFGVISQDAASQAVIAQEGSPSGLVLRFVNSIAADLEGEFPGVTFQTLAYRNTFEAPLITTPRSNVIIRLTDIQASFSIPLDDPRNAVFTNELAAWKLIADPLYMWDYASKFWSPGLPHPNLRVLGPNLQFLAQNGVTGVFEEGAFSEMAEIRTWMLGQLLWDPNRDPQALMDTFVNGYYGAAAPHIFAYIDVLHDAVEASGDYMSCCDPGTLDYLALDTVNLLLSHLEAAEAAVILDGILLTRVQLFKQPALLALQLHGIFGDVAARASSSHGSRPPVEAINGSGMTPDGLRHISLGSDPILYGQNAWLSGTRVESLANPRGGTAPGSHWIEFAFDTPRPLGEMWIWNYHEYIPTSGVDWRVQGSRIIAVQHSITGSNLASDWTMVHAGELPISPATAEAPVSLVVDFEGATAQHVVITTSSSSSLHNWSNGANDESGISEVRFFPPRTSAQFTPTLVTDMVELTFDGDAGSYRLEYTTDPAQPIWTAAGPVLQSAGGTITTHDATGASPLKIYRLVVE
jgi:hypothetical protein